MNGDLPQFLPHGSTRFERRGQVLLLHSEGPFNAEHVVALGPRFREQAAIMAPGGPWVSVNLVRGSILTPPDALAALTRSAEASRGLGRIGIGYVVDPAVEGYRVMRPLILLASESVLPTRFFEELDAGLRWAEGLLATAAAGRR
jgi:hypothetical protein